MIKKIFYMKKRTYIKDIKDVEVTTDNLTLGDAFNLAFQTNAKFYYSIVDDDDIKTIDNTLLHLPNMCNRKIVDFFNKCTEYGIHFIIPKDYYDCFGMKGARKVISNIIDDYNTNQNLYNLEDYSTDTYIARVIYDDLKNINDNKHDTRVTALLSTIPSDYYDLDEFLELLQSLPKTTDDHFIEDFKKKFERDYDKTSEALEWNIETLVNYGGDYTHKIYKAMIEVINDILNDKPSTDKDGLIQYLKEIEEC